MSRADASLFELVTDEEELVQALRHRRHELGLSGEEVEFRNPKIQRGYISKLEHPNKSYGRHCVYRMLFEWLKALGMVLYVVPAIRALRTDICPACCRPLEPNEQNKRAA